MRSRTETLSALDEVGDVLDTQVFEKTAKFSRGMLYIHITHRPTKLKMGRVVCESDLFCCQSLKSLLGFEIESIVNAFRENGVAV